MKNKDYILYLDMDGVLVDFESGYRKIARGSGFSEIASQYGEKQAQEEYLREGFNFWTGLDWIHGGKELWRASTNLFEHVGILSSAGTRDPIKGEMVEKGKRAWLAKNIPELPVDHIVIVLGKEVKQEFADKRSILVDDVPTTIQQWNAQGGYGILHNAAHYKKTIEELEDIARPIKISELVRRVFWKR